MSHQKNNPLEKLSRVEQEKFLELVKAKYDAETYDKYHTYFFQDSKINEKGYDISRKNYKKHTLFMAMGRLYRERAFIAPNRVGKSYTGGFEVTAHITKDYPEWWEGKVFPKHKQLEFLVVGKTNNSLIQTTQKLLVGTTFDIGSGMIPKEMILADKITKKPNCPGGIQDLYVRDKYGCINHLQFMSSDVEDSVIMGRELDGVWFDEECLNSALYDEAIMRTMTTNGFVMTTFTPMDGLTKAIIRFMPGGKFPEGGIVRDKEGSPTGCYTVHCGWNDITHLPKEDQEDIRKRYSGPQLLARTEGIPSIGAGHIYPIPVKEVVVPTFPVPDHWPRAFGLDFGWRETAAVWVCKNPDTGQMYVYSEYHKGERLPYAHVNAIQAKDDWIRGVCDPAGIATNGTDGKNYIQEYRNLGLNIIQGVNDLQTGIAQILGMLEQGTLKFMSHCVHLLDEYSVYCYDDKGKPAREQDDHELDALRYLTPMFDYVAQSKAEFEMSKYFDVDSMDKYSTYNRDSLTGY